MMKAAVRWREERSERLSEGFPGPAGPCGLSGSCVSAGLRPGVRSYGFSFSNNLTPLSRLTSPHLRGRTPGTSLVLETACSWQPGGFSDSPDIVNVCVHKALGTSASILNGLLQGNAEELVRSRQHDGWAVHRHT